MEIEEAIKEVERISSAWPENEALKIAIESMKMCKKEKPIKEKHNFFEKNTSVYRYKCPNCKYMFAKVEERSRFCPFCGKRVDWSGE